MPLIYVDTHKQYLLYFDWLFNGDNWRGHTRGSCYLGRQLNIILGIPTDRQKMLLMKWIESECCGRFPIYVRPEIVLF